MNSLPRAHGKPLCSVLFRKSPEDFIVNERLIFEPDGEGEHVYLQIKKRNTNTQWLAKQLAIFSGIKQRDVSYAGLKDRNAVTTQWFSLLLHPEKEPDWSRMKLEGIEIITCSRHRCKLRPGMVKVNQFIITLRNVDCSKIRLNERINLLKQYGVPNYYGEQRFGHGGENVQKAISMLNGELKIKDRKLKGIYLSAARSYLFNKVLKERVSTGTWNKAMDGDCMMLDGTNSFFKVSEVDEALKNRLSTFDIHTTAPLWGVGEPSTSLAVKVLEDNILADDEIIKAGLEKMNMKLDRRSLRMKVNELTYDDSSPEIIKLTFELNSGQYATTLLHEVFTWDTEKYQKAH